MKLNWTIAKIEDIAEVNPRLGKADIPDDLLVSFVPMPAVGAGDGVIDVSNARPFAEVKKGFTTFQQGDVLFAKITPCMENGKMAVVPEVKNGYGFGSTEFHVLRPKPDVNARYLYFFVSSKQFRGEAEHQMTGAVGQKRVPTQFLREANIPLAPFNEQTRIVAEIEKQFSLLDEAVANLKRVKANLKRYKAAVLKSAVEGKLTEEWRKQHPDVEPADKLLERILAERRKAAGKGKYKEPVAPDTSGLPELPAGWVWASVEQVSAKVVDCPHSTAKFTENGHPCLDTTCIAPSQVLHEKLRFVSDETYQERIARLKPQAGDVVFAREGTVGTAVVVPDGFAPCLGQRVMLMRIDSCTTPKFFSMALLSFVVRAQYLPKIIGSTAPHLNVADVKALAIPLPPLAEQHQIVAEVERRLSIVAGAETQVDANLRRADRLRQSILKQAFSGQLVPQNPNDEPASVLLERIRNGALVGANKHSPRNAPRQSKRANIDSPLQKQQNPRQPAEPEPAAEPNFACMDAVLTAILGRMQPGREYARSDLADPLGLSNGKWNAAIQELKRRGQVRQTGEKRGARYRTADNV